MTTFAERSEDSVTGELARIYAQIRETYGAPYVSSLQRHLATYPGVLEWAWGIVAPGFHNGLIPHTAWRIAGEADHGPSLMPLDAMTLSSMGIDEQGLQSIRNICENFIRVAPLNLLFAGCVRAILEGARLPSALQHSPQQQKPPDPLLPMPAMLNPEALSASMEKDLAQLSTTLADQTFTPGLYRMLVHWPDYLTHVANEIGPRLTDPGFQANGEQLANRIVSTVPMILDALPMPPPLPAPDESLTPHLIEATQTYRRTSPEMVLVGTLLLIQLPETMQ